MARGKLQNRLAVLLVLSFLASPAWPQNHKKEDQPDPKYVMELAKYWSFGFENFKNKQYRDAIKHFWTVAKLDTIDKFTDKVYRYLGDSYYRVQDPDSAQICYELGIQKTPDNVYLHRMVAFLLTNRNLIDEAIKEYETIVGLEPDAKEDWMRLASLYVRAEEIEKAIEAYDKVLKLDPNNLEAQNNKAALLQSLGDIEAVIAEKEKIREQDPENSQVRFELGKMYFDQGQYELAVERYLEYLQLTPNDVLAMENVGIAYQRLEKYRDAIAMFQKIVSLEPGNKKVLAEISRCYKELGQFSTARVWARKALAVDRDYGLGWIALGEIYETAADRCIERKGGKVDFDDKLVYELADDQYRNALKDTQFRAEAERHRSFIKAVLPTKEDKFMHKGQTKAKGDCYTWIY